MMYLQYGIEFKYGKQDKPEDKPVSMIGQSADEIRASRDALRKQFGKNIEGL